MDRSDLCLDCCSEAGGGAEAILWVFVFSGKFVSVAVLSRGGRLPVFIFEWGDQRLGSCDYRAREALGKRGLSC